MRRAPSVQRIGSDRRVEVLERGLGPRLVIAQPSGLGEGARREMVPTGPALSAAQCGFQVDRRCSRHASGSERAAEPQEGLRVFFVGAEQRFDRGEILLGGAPSCTAAGWRGLL